MPHHRYPPMNTCPVCGRTETPSTRWHTPANPDHPVSAATLTARLYDLAADVGIIIVQDTAIGEAGAAAALSTGKDLDCGRLLALADNLDDHTRVDVIAFGLSALCGIPDTIADTPEGWVGVDRERLPVGSDRVGHIAWHIAHKVGHDTPSATFELVIPPPP